MTGNPPAARRRAVKKRTRASAKTTVKAGTAGATGRKGKYNASGEHVDGKWMASAAEAERYRQLLRMEMFGLIGQLETQVHYDLVVNNKKVAGYKADFRYNVLDDQGEPIRQVIEDVKGMITDVFEIKHKLFDALIDTPLSIIHVKGKAIHPDNPGEGSTNKGWMHKHWDSKIPDPA